MASVRLVFAVLVLTHYRSDWSCTIPASQIQLVNQLFPNAEGVLMVVDIIRSA